MYIIIIININPKRINRKKNNNNNNNKNNKDNNIK